ncbi:TfoX/Sxy family protein [Geodermatophilus sp. DSM 44513]|uniref:TfoX/Sxy family protein n=1 Tax=Geodermatophilus sp. DSM 44513 TaxID=1528104 RepID=UPI00127C6ABA|nr:TfoX/Sxy family protein [Geodermatophilus sp. DSM 44513]WNV76590.1 TfoX/Sxy family protein [Geodermatophilus sp. DSM 44513]
MDAAARLTALVDALAGEPGVTPPDTAGPRRFGSRTLTVHGATFAMVVGGALVLKVPEARVTALLADGTGRPFGTDAGRPYREWVSLPQGEPATDLPLAREALDFTRTARP